MRRVLTFSCEGDTLVGTLDRTAGEVGVLIISGGNEIRVGAHRGMAMLAARLAAVGIPCFRYDRRGIGDSSGTNTGFEGSAPDVVAAAATFRAEAPGLTRIVALGNCDAASALALFHADAGIDALILSNPWTGESGSGDMPPAAAIRARYWHRASQPAEWLRLIRGGVNFRKLLRGLRQVAKTPSQAPALLSKMADALRASGAPTTILLADRDNTAIAFRAGWERIGPPAVTVRTLSSASHSFASAADKDWLFDRVVEAIR